MLKQICRMSGLVLIVAMMSIPALAQDHLNGDGYEPMPQALGGYGPGACTTIQPETPQKAKVIAQRGNRGGGGAGNRGKGANGGVCPRS